MFVEVLHAIQPLSFKLLPLAGRECSVRENTPPLRLEKLSGEYQKGCAEENDDDNNQAANKADMRVTMEKPMTKPPAVGANVDVIGVISEYTPDPFMFTMTKADLPGAKPAAKTPAKKGPAKKGTAKKKTAQ